MKCGSSLLQRLTFVVLGRAILFIFRKRSEPVCVPIGSKKQQQCPSWQSAFSRSTGFESPSSVRIYVTCPLRRPPHVSCLSRGLLSRTLKVRQIGESWRIRIARACKLCRIDSDKARSRFSSGPEPMLRKAFSVVLDWHISFLSSI